MNYKKLFAVIWYTLLSLSFLLIIYAAFIEPKLICIKHYNLYLPNFSSKHNGLKVAIMSDFHIGGLGINEKQLQKFVNKTNKEKPDIIFLLGDFDSLRIYYSKKVKADNIPKILSKLNAKYGVYSVLGNHDYDSKLLIKPLLKKTKIKVLEDELIAVDINSEKLNIYGLKDFWHYDYNFNLIDKTQKSVIVLTHNPDTFPLLPKNISLALAGHTHGGQIYLPYIGGVFCSSMYDQRFIKGYIVENNKHLYVTSGIGNVGPFRFGIPPEIVILTLYSQDDFPENKIINTKPLKGKNIEKVPLIFAQYIRDNYKPKLIKYFGYI